MGAWALQCGDGSVEWVCGTRAWRWEHENESNIFRKSYEHRDVSIGRYGNGSVDCLFFVDQFYVDQIFCQSFLKNRTL